MTDFNEIMQAAKKMQEQMKQAQEELANTVIQGESGAGLVKISMNGKHDAVGVELHESLLSEDKTILEDLIAAAINDAVRKIDEKNRGTLGDMAGGFKMPDGMKFPF